MEAAPGDRLRRQAFGAYVGRCGGTLWRRALLLAGGERATAQQLWVHALATTSAGWREDSDDVVEIHLALRTMCRHAVQLPAQPPQGCLRAQPAPASTGPLASVPAELGWQRLARPARAGGARRDRAR